GDSEAAEPPRTVGAAKPRQEAVSASSKEPSALSKITRELRSLERLRSFAVNHAHCVSVRADTTGFPQPHSTASAEAREAQAKSFEQAGALHRRRQEPQPHRRPAHIRSAPVGDSDTSPTATGEGSNPKAARLIRVQNAANRTDGEPDRCG